jgi:TPR repeat protein
MMRIVLAAALAVALAASFARGARADLEAGINAYLDADYALALVELQPLAQAGDTIAQFYLAEMHLHGWGVAQNFEEAAAWYAKAAEFGHPEAQAALGSLQMLGLGVPRYPSNAFFWLILSVVWQDSDMRLAAMTSLGEVAAQLTPEQRQTIGGVAANQWRQQ